MTSQLTHSKKLLTSRYNATTFQAGIVEALRDIAQQELVDACCELKPQMTSKATRRWLDWLASRFGVGRPTKLRADTFFFGFDGNPQSTPFNHSPFRPDGDTSSTNVPVGDETFRRLLGVRTGALRTDGSQDDLNEILSQAYPGSFYVDNQDMTATLYLSVDATPDDLSVILSVFQQLPKPAGVRINIEAYRVFGFDGAGEVFDSAPFVIT